MLNRNAIRTKNALRSLARAFVTRVFGDVERIRLTGFPTVEDKARNPQDVYRHDWEETVECRCAYLHALREDARRWDSSFDDLASYETKSAARKSFGGEIPLRSGAGVDAIVSESETAQSFIVHRVSVDREIYQDVLSFDGLTMNPRSLIFVLRGRTKRVRVAL